MTEEKDVVDELEVTLQLRRTAFLSVLCILTWIWCAIILIYTIIAFSTAFVENAAFFDHIGTNLFWFLITAGSALFCTLGAMMMWFLNRWGFVLYTVGQLAPILFSFYRAIIIEEIHGVSLIFTILFNVIPIGFIVLYAINVPGMKPWSKRQN